ncbi:hypothetical protein ACFQZ4_52805 [Catellatospora coxensis]
MLQDAIVDELIATNPARHLRISHRYRPKFTPGPQRRRGAS